MNANDISSISKKAWQRVRHKYVTLKPPFDLEARTRNLLTVKEILDEIGLKFWLTNGTALAAYREKDWIPWDDDVDLDVMAEDFDPLYPQLRNKFLSAGFIVRGAQGPKRVKMSLFRDKEKTALRGLYRNPSFRKDKYRLRKLFKYPRRFYETPGTLVFQGVEFNVPSPIEGFLVYAYGENWRTPIKSDNQKVYSTKKILRK